MADSETVFAYIGIGCMVIVGLMAIAMGACGVWVYSEAQRFEEELSDPEVRGNRVLEVLGAESLPEGYHPMMAFSIPFVMDTAMLTDIEPEPGRETEPNFGDRGFVYVKILRMGQNEQELRDYFEGRTDNADVLSDNGININVEEVIARDVMTLGTADVLYVVQRGRVSMGGRGRRQDAGLASMSLIECSGDSRLRIGIWFVPDPDPEAPPEELDLTGTPGDPDAMANFYSHFDLCG
ncbi:MAG: hypothetical protein GKS06_07465 [Acidobacteria bacterium]|nr:hypothetical protein [Acidobacteriota bacterium]